MKYRYLQDIILLGDLVRINFPRDNIPWHMFHCGQIHTIQWKRDKQEISNKEGPTAITGIAGGLQYYRSLATIGIWGDWKGDVGVKRFDSRSYGTRALCTINCRIFYVMSLKKNPDLHHFHMYFSVSTLLQNLIVFFAVLVSTNWLKSRFWCLSIGLKSCFLCFVSTNWCKIDFFAFQCLQFQDYSYISVIIAKTFGTHVQVMSSSI